MQRKCVRECHVLPEEGVVLNADLPQSLRGPMVGQLEAYGALKLFILSGEVKEEREGEEDRESEGEKCGEKMEGWWQGELCLLRSNVEINAVFLFTRRNVPCHVR